MMTIINEYATNETILIVQLSSLCEGDLQSIVQMGFGQKEDGFQSQVLHGKKIFIRMIKVFLQ